MISFHDHANRTIKLFALYLITVITSYCTYIVSTNTSIITSSHFVLQDLVSFSVKDGKDLLIIL